MDSCTKWLIRGMAVVVILVGATGTIAIVRTMMPKGENKVSIDIDKIRATGNSCPSGWAYMGGGYCQEVKCRMDSFGSNHPTLAGKGWICPKKPLFGRGFSILGGKAVRSTTDARCPEIEPDFGKNNSCLNGLSEQEIFDHPMAHTQRPNRVPVDWSKKF